MATKEIPITGYEAKLLGRVEVAEGTMTEMMMSQKTWKGETGLIDKEMLSRHLTDLQGRIYYLAGPPPWWQG